MERWLFKTMASAGMMMKAKLPEWTVPPNMASHVFGGETLPSGAGLYLFTDVGDQLEFGKDAAHILFAKDMTAAQIEVWGMPFLAALEQPTGRLSAEGKMYSAERLLHRPRRLLTDNARVDWLWEPNTSYRDKQLKRFGQRFRPPRRKR